MNKREKRGTAVVANEFIDEERDEISKEHEKIRGGLKGIENEFWGIFHDEAIMFMNEAQREAIQNKLAPPLAAIRQKAFERGKDAGHARRRERLS